MNLSSWVEITAGYTGQATELQRLHGVESTKLHDIIIGAGGSLERDKEHFEGTFDKQGTRGFL